MGEGESFLVAIGPLLISGAAALAAVVAARTANQRQQTQLDNDQARLRAELQHDDEMRRRGHTLIVLDEAFELSEKALWVFSAYENALRELEQARERRQALTGDATEKKRAQEDEAIAKLLKEAVKERGEASDVVANMFTTVLRVSMRVGKDHETLKKYQALARSYASLKDLLDVGLGANRSEEQHRKCEEADEDATRKYSSALEECQRWFVGGGR